jgi:hypothetical protein
MQGDGGLQAMHSSLIGKVEKANRYARELDRISFEELAVTFKGDNDTHTRFDLTAKHGTALATSSRVGGLAFTSLPCKKSWA